MRNSASDNAMAKGSSNDPAEVAALLNRILEEGGQGELLAALRHLSKDFGGVPKVAEQAHLNRTQLYRTLSCSGNPELRSLMSVLKVMGLRLAVQPASHNTSAS